MTNTAGTSATLVQPGDLAEEAVTLVRRWLAEGAKVPVDAAAAQLAGVLKDPQGLDFTVGFVDGVIRPEDKAVAAKNLKVLAPKVPSFLPWYMKSAVALGGSVAPVVPGVVIPVARKVLREMVSHLIVDATEDKLGRSIAKIKKDGIRLNVNLLGEAILGEGEASRRLEGTRKLLSRPDVDYVSIKVSSTVAPHNHWAFDEAVGHIVEKLAPLYQLAASSSPRKFINLDMEEYKDLDLTIAVFTRLLEMPEFRDLEAGIVLQAYLPDALSAMIGLQDWAAARTANGGAPIKVRVVKGANLPMELVDADLHGWPLATWGAKQDSDTSYKAVINYSLTPERIRNVRIGVAGHNLFDVALAHLLGKARGITSGLEFEMLLGMATGQAEAVKRDVGSLLLYTPVVHPSEFDVAIAYLIRRLEEGASQENFMSAVFELDKNEALFEREKQRFLASLAALTDKVPGPNRVQDRTSFDAVTALTEATSRAGLENGGKGYGGPTASFANTPDTDPDLPANRTWGRSILNQVPFSILGEETAKTSELNSRDELEAVIETALTRGKSWGALTGAERATVLHRAGVRLEAHRADLLEVMASECGKTLDQGDPEVSEAIDFAHYYAELAKELDTVDGAEFIPSKLTVVTPPWNFPVAIPAGSVLAALAAGSAVVIKPARQARRSGAVMVEALWEAFDEAGIDRDVLQYVQVGKRELGTALVSHPKVDRLILTGGYETAELFRSFRKDLPLLAETSGKNAIIVTPSADLDLAARDVVQSAFGHAGQKCSAASLVILVGSVATSRRFNQQLIDAARSLKVGYPVDPQTQMGPVIESANGKLLGGLTTLGHGESWVLEPRKLDDSGKLWSPGVRTGVKRGSEYHKTEYFGPILGVMTAETLEEAVSIVNDIDYGLTSGLHSLDPQELKYWLDNVQAGNLYINRGITGAIVRRQPFGGWKKSAVGAGTKAGGPNYLVGLGEWKDAPITANPLAQLPAAARQLLSAAADIASAGSISATDVTWLESALISDAEAWEKEFGAARDVSGLGAERNIFRYRPLPVTIRYEAATSGHGLAELLRVVSAGLTAWNGHPELNALTVSTPEPLTDAVARVLRDAGVVMVVENSAAWAARVKRYAGKTGPESGVRIRLIGAAALATAEAANGKPDVAIYANDVVAASRVELLTFLQEQAVSITAHRFGTPNDLSGALI
ncbi:bifunctional proline dehydrogenase/L-glutamate gamma-semialdehyde dehydrogenase [Pseudarthrobacter sp. NamE5]|uniref:proline dehydrogenase family protein n=1 Tax=Pseudarthrobacter sp. NamE5 TaxID=2576839 RepID=UPI00110AC41A|nr:bifunctional proline dehydrogenase/L-glutamate gamma-semialdehyde dehydrogenase [Pseudarthrobacter sp. NamE5]TLM82483.1 aldehyde dehydrogenase family protein [Pseudarthrobacter sp. NamE5]